MPVWQCSCCYTPFSVAVEDPKFLEEGLHAQSSFRDLMHYFDLSQHELHEFSCDCGGRISQSDMAKRIRDIADGKSKSHHVYVYDFVITR